MGIYSAISTAVSGLRAQSSALEHISGNIANSQTIGYKRTETNFVDLIPDAAPTRQAAGVVLASSRATNEVQGNIESSDTDTYMAVNGDGFFVVSEKVGTADSLPVFADTDLYTRRGDFKLDKDGYLVNGAGYYLQGLAVDSTTGNVSGSVPTPIRIDNDFLPAEATTQITYRANLPASPASGEMVPGDFATDPTAGNDEYVTADDQDTFIEQSIAGGAVTAYDATGSSVNIQFRWALTDDSTNTWNLFYLEDSDATGANAMWRNIGTDFEFGTDGQLTAPAGALSGLSFTVDGMTLSGLTMTDGDGGLTQFADVNTASAGVTELSQDGYPAGELVGISVSETGRIISTYSNGRQLEMAEVVLAGFNGDDALRKRDGSAYLETNESGPPIYGAAGSIVGAATESSNTDLADEFSKLIVTQQAYTANSRVVTTSDEMLQEVLNIVR
ncbi:MAG: hypothetical protein C0606_12225 [Hyphomicrobiales bacterium]|nr:MAG: hypothetical protein C0606_12225 [Hyphomicrobiales bacterium]